MSQEGDEGSASVTANDGPKGNEVDLEALKCYLRDASKNRLLYRGIKEVTKFLIREEGKLCVLVDSCPLPQYVKMVELLCKDKSVPLIRLKDSAKLSELAGLCPQNKIGESHKIPQCNSVIVIKGDMEDSSEAATIMEYARSLSV